MGFAGHRLSGTGVWLCLLVYAGLPACSSNHSGETIDGFLGVSQPTTGGGTDSSGAAGSGNGSTGSNGSAASSGGTGGSGISFATGVVTGTLSVANGGTGSTSAQGARDNLGLGTAATQSVGTGPGNLVQLDGSSRLPAVDGSQITGVTNIANNAVSSNALANGAVTDAKVAVGANIQVSKLQSGSAGQVLTMSGGVPTWQAPSGGAAPAPSSGAVLKTAVNAVSGFVSTTLQTYVPSNGSVTIVPSSTNSTLLVECSFTAQFTQSGQTSVTPGYYLQETTGAAAAISPSTTLRGFSAASTPLTIMQAASVVRGVTANTSTSSRTFALYYAVVTNSGANATVYVYNPVCSATEIQN